MRVIVTPTKRGEEPLRHRPPPLNALRAFEAVARHLSMTGAAGELGVTQGAISRQVINLEQFLGFALFRRSPLGMTLTDHGAKYYAMVGATLEELYTRHAMFLREIQRNILKVMLPPTFAMRWLVPRLHRFHAAYPEIAPQITTSHQLADFAHDDVDVAIWSTPKLPDDLRRIRLFGEVLLPVCSPRLLENGPPLREPSDLRHHVLLYSLQRPDDWTVWLSTIGAVDIGSHGSIKFENSGLAYQGAIDCAGIAMAQSRLVQDDIAAGRLVVPFPKPVRSNRAYYLITPREQLPHNVQCFQEWLRREIAQDSQPPGKLAEIPPRA
jgi:LysR family transcriptional regulator, glycine cleavage system transcriptional activator